MKKEGDKTDYVIDPEKIKKQAEKSLEFMSRYSHIEKDWINDNDYIDESELFIEAAKALESEKRDHPSVYWHDIETHITFDPSLARMMLYKFAATCPKTYDKALKEIANKFDVETRLVIRNFKGKVKEKKAKEGVMQIIEKHKLWNEAFENWEKMKKGEFK